jgi:hypothetical protein
MMPPPAHAGNIAAVKRLLQAVAELIPDGAPAAPQRPGVPSAPAHIANAIAKDIASGRVRA